MVLVFPEGAWLEILPWDDMVCRDEFYRAYEWMLRRLCYRYEHFNDDFGNRAGDRSAAGI